MAFGFTELFSLVLYLGTVFSLTGAIGLYILYKIRDIRAKKQKALSASKSGQSEFFAGFPDVPFEANRKEGVVRLDFEARGSEELYLKDVGQLEGKTFRFGRA